MTHRIVGLLQLEPEAPSRRRGRMARGLHCRTVVLSDVNPGPILRLYSEAQVVQQVELQK